MVWTRVLNRLTDLCLDIPSLFSYLNEANLGMISLVFKDLDTLAFSFLIRDTHLY